MFWIFFFWNTLKINLMEINYPLYKCLTSRVTKRLLSLNDIQPVHLLPPPNQTSAMAESHTRETNCVYVETSLDTHLLVLLHDRETISDFKGKSVFHFNLYILHSMDLMILVSPYSETMQGASSVFSPTWRNWYICG